VSVLACTLQLDSPTSELWQNRRFIAANTYNRFGRDMSLRLRVFGEAKDIPVGITKPRNLCPVGEAKFLCRLAQGHRTFRTASGRALIAGTEWTT
jgi:hypothetical protein